MTFFSLLFLSIFLTEGLGVQYGREIAFYLILITPFFLFFFDKIYQRYILLPKKITILFSLFFLATVISTASSVNLQRSFEQFLIYLSCFLIFIYVYNHKKEVKRHFFYFILILPIVFLFYSLILKLTFGKQWSFILMPSSGYQFVYSYFKSHNHLGDLLALALILSFYYYFKTNKKIYLWLIFLYTLPFFLSYSRSAYLSLGVTLSFLFLIIKKRSKFPALFYKRFLYPTGLIFSILLVFFIASVSEVKKVPLLKSVHQVLSQRFELQTKDFFANRNEYFAQVVSSFKERPLFGVGANNFFYASIKYTKIPYHWTYSSHNLLLDILTENGLIAFFFFFIILILIIASSYKKITGLFFVFLAMLFNVQTDYTHTIYSFLLLFFIIGGLIYDEHDHYRLNDLSFTPVLVLSAIIFSLCHLLLLSKILLKQQKYMLSFYFYPLNQQVYEPVIKNALNDSDFNTVLPILGFYGRLFSGEAKVLEEIANLYKQKGDKKKALFYYEKTYTTNPFLSFEVIENVYKLKMEIEGKKEAKEFIEAFLQRLKRVKNTYFIPTQFKKQLMNFCGRKKYLNCFEYLEGRFIP